MSGVAHQRLSQERKQWRKDHPFGYVAKPKTNSDGSVDMMHWQCRIPGKKGTIWEEGLYPVDLRFSTDYPALPPVARFPAGFFHPNIYDDGKVCLSILNPEQSWQPSISVKQILVGIAELLTEPKNSDAAQTNAYEIYKRKDKSLYERKVRVQARKYAESSHENVKPGQ
ncbi:hypothetical protein CVIRNUC_009086 [Coccomyxa viridis]|uniref:SUMO-conjugating enzyme UBC9 n=1 Tax=Coccomyxa viridis TaxID=1274662 RepID=A0AAV1IEX1_9CHLO|nr:hypothetical protein CVIRNUC_009086 [Coccomyxa viridis]